MTRKRSSGPFVVGGQPVAGDRYPWHVSLGLVTNGGSSYGDVQGHRAGGLSIARHWILTAAHSFDIVAARGLFRDHVFVTRPDAMWRVLSGSRLDAPLARADVERVVRHPAYDAASMKCDLALVRIDTGGWPTVALASRRPPDDACAAVLGWGYTSDAAAVSITLRRAGARVRSDAICRQQQWNAATGDPGTMLCAGGTARGCPPLGAPSRFDSGGGLVLGIDAAPVAAGIVSWSAEIGDPDDDVPDVYARIDAHRDWIERWVPAAQWRDPLVIGD